MTAQFDAIVLGGGAAGLFCAAQAGQRGRRVLVLERNAEPGRKILISGGGRGKLSFRQPAFRQIGAGALYPARLSRAGGGARNCLA